MMSMLMALGNHANLQRKQNFRTRIFIIKFFHMLGCLPTAPKKELANRLSWCPNPILLSQLFETNNLRKLGIAVNFSGIHDIKDHEQQVNVHTMETKTIANCKR